MFIFLQLFNQGLDYLNTVSENESNFSLDPKKNYPAKKKINYLDKSLQK